jgi:HlyD family secretion protein
MTRLSVAVAVLTVPIAAFAYSYTHKNPPPTFITAPVERGTILRTVTATGTVDALITVDVSSQLSGRIAEVFVDFNDTVQVGQPLARLDQDLFAARVSEARAALKVAGASVELQRAGLERAKVALVNTRTAQKITEAQLVAAQVRQHETEAEFQRKSALVRTGTVSEQDFSQARAARDAGIADLLASSEQVAMKTEAVAIAAAELRMAAANLESADAIAEQRQAALSQAELDFNRAVLLSPIDGVIIKRDVNPGQTIAVSLEAKALFKIAHNLSEMQVYGKIDEADVGQLKVGQVAHFSVDTYPNRTFVGRVLQIRISPEVQQNVVTYTAVISASNHELLLFPGMTALLHIVVSNSGEILKVPNQALRFRPDRPTTDTKMASSSADAPATVWRVGGDGRPTPVVVGIGHSDDDATELVAGPLIEGEPVILGIANAQTTAGFWRSRLGF